MANPNNAIGTNAAFGGRTSPNAFNDVLGAFQSRGILSGWVCSPDSGMSVVLGGDGINRDVAIAEDNAGNKTTVNNISGSPVAVTIGAAPASQSRIDAIVVYIENPPQGTATATDNYGTIGVLDVQGNTASTPVAPNESAIRTAITADGASGATAYYVVLAYVTVASGTTDITSEMITAGDAAILQSELTDIPANTITTSMIQNGAVTSNKIDYTTINYGEVGVDIPIGKFNNKTVYRRCETWNGFSQSGWNVKQFSSNLNNDVILNTYGMCYQPGNGAWIPIARVRPNASTYAVGLSGVLSGEAQFEVGADVYAGVSTIYLFIEYTKSS